MPGRIAEPAVLLKNHAYAQIKQRIQDATFPAGAFLSERQLAAMLDMSKTPIRAALERLEQEGFVAVSPQQGIIVRELSLQEIADHFELRGALETFVARKIAGRLTDRQIALIERNLNLQQVAADRQAVQRLVRLDAEFHWLLCHASGNLAIVDCIRQHRERMHRIIAQVMSRAAGRMQDAVDEHREIFVAVRDNRPRQAMKLLEQHLEFGRQYLLGVR
jgi:DNA-binding GntR family transcriptional regulator